MSAPNACSIPRARRAVGERLACALLALLPLTLHAGSVSHSAQLRLARQGAPLHGIVDLEFTVYDAANGGTALVNRTAPATAFHDGLANVIFETDPASLDGRALWVEVRIVDPASAGTVVLAPRIALTPAPLAVVAGRTVPGAVGTASINSDQVQRSVRSSCPADRPRMQSISRFGAPLACAVDAGITGIDEGPGLDVFEGTTVSIDIAQTQRRRTPHCDPGSSMRQLPIVGVPVCVPDQSPFDARTRVEATCTFSGASDVQSGCAATPRCPVQAPVALGGGYFSNCAAATLNASYPVDDQLGRGWTTWVLKGAGDSCAGTPTLTAYVECAAGP